MLVSDFIVWLFELHLKFSLYLPATCRVNWPARAAERQRHVLFTESSTVAAGDGVRRVDMFDMFDIN